MIQQIANSPAQASLYFPEIAGTSITSKSKEINTTDVLKGKISLVGMLSTRASEVSILRSSAVHAT